MEYLLGIDFGGSSSKATLIDRNGKIICTASEEYPMYYPKDDFCEQKAEDAYEACKHNIRAILDKSGIRSQDIVALALDAATHMAVLLDDKDQVIRNVIHWSDSRSGEESAFLNREYLDTLRNKCYNQPSPLWTLPQLMWLKKHEPESLQKVHKLLFMKDYIRHRLTGDYYTDSIEAMGCLMMDETTGQWDPELCALAGIPLSAMPEVKDPAFIVGGPTTEACRETGLSPNTKIIVGTTDTALEVYASGSIRKGQATVKLATAGRICPVTEQGFCHEMLVNYRHVVPGMWYPGTANKTSAASYRWYRDVLCAGEMEEAKRQGVSAYSLMTAAAALTPPGAEGLCFHPYLQGESTPYMDNNLRASFTGVSGMHTKGHFSRAVMEGVCFSLKDSLNLLKQLGIAPTTANIIGGGGSTPVWAQMTADILNLPLTKVKNDDSSLGSAMLAGVAVGIFSSFDHSVEVCVEPVRMYMPDPKNVELYERYFERYRAIHDALAPIYTKYKEN